MADAMPAFDQKLQVGSSGPDVALVQTWLNGVRSRWTSLPALTVDGRFGTNTRQAVEEFQLLAGLERDGVVGKNTWDALYQQYAALHGAGERYPGVPLRRGQQGAVVRSAQQKLKRMFPALAADGRFGQRTEAAVKAWQSLKGLTGDGVIGPRTWATLDDI